MLQVADVLSLFNEVLGVEYEPSLEVRSETERFLKFLGEKQRLTLAAAESLLLADINAKFRLNADAIAHALAYAARRNITFNYHEKRAIARAVDSASRSALRETLHSRLSRQDADELLVDVRWIDKAGTLHTLHNELKSPTLTRKDSKARDWAPEILEGLFTTLVASAFGLEALHRFNDPMGSANYYEPDFWLYLQQRYPELYSTKPRLIVLRSLGSGDVDALLSKVRSAYGILPEFGYVAILLTGDGGREWSLASAAVLYAEKHVRRSVRNTFFRRREVQAATVACVPGVDPAAAQFGIWNDGFYFQDCFVIESSPLRLLLLLQKREANETPLPCPSCRSLRVQGNSYPSLGVKSWECTSVLCPGKSKFGRGRRYSFLQLLKQAAIEEPGNEIPAESVKAWLRDVQPSRREDEILEMLVRHYSLANDRILIDDSSASSDVVLARKLERGPLPTHSAVDSTIPPSEFFTSEWFARYVVAGSSAGELPAPRVATVGSLTALHGDAAVALQALSSNWVDGAVTSPPYYNAREYSQWQNLYCYLSDIRRVNAEVFRVLRPGAYYLYNIFDHFDNDNTVVLSAMGDRRLPLGAYTVDLFRRIGFECVGTVVWDKGDIEGKRGFNGGNFSPYYQAPFNCWEYVLIFRKPSATSPRYDFPAILRQGAIIKMVGGANIHGHSAPYPEAIPALLTSRLSQGATVLDPFAGSMTTAIAAARSGCNAICVEKDVNYFDLGLRKFKESLEELVLI